MESHNTASSRNQIFGTRINADFTDFCFFVTTQAGSKNGLSSA